MFEKLRSLALEKLPGTHENQEELFTRSSLFKQEIVEKHGGLVLCITHSGMVNALKSSCVLETGKLEVWESVHLCSSHSIKIDY